MSSFDPVSLAVIANRLDSIVREMENTLLRVSGALFCHDAKAASTHTDEIVLNAGITEKTILVRARPRFFQTRDCRTAVSIVGET